MNQWLLISKNTINERGWSGTILKVMDSLTEWPVVTIRFIATKYQISIVQATKIVGHLVDIGVLRELTGNTYNRAFGAHEVMKIVDSI